MKDTFLPFESHHPKKTQNSKPETWIRKEQCDDISFIDFSPFDNNQLSLLHEEVIAMINSEIKEGNKEGIYDDDRVLETNSEIYKANKPKTPDVINFYEESTQKKMDKIIRCYEKKIRENYMQRNNRLPKLL
ncbi:hypothetical protein MHK_001524 [Candidatus Magnetomorum sp. HK-1]|nr:hypothetical protein MHK_001524 [Candidatus Magnetomorum sp. HK-1]